MKQLASAALLGLCLVTSLAAQQLSLGAVSGSPGQVVSLSVLLASQGAQVAGLQFDLAYNTADLSITAVAGVSAAAAGKSVSTNNLSNGNLRIIVVGFNQSVMTDGSIANLTIQLAANAAPSNYPITFLNLSASDPGANAIPLGASNGSVTVTGTPGQLAIVGPGSMPVATVNAAYSQAVTASGGVAPYAWSATGLPNGLSITGATGVISGTPASVAGNPFNVLVTVTDSRSAVANKSYTLTVNPALVVSGPASLPLGALNVNYPATAVTASGGSGVYTWSATGLPPGLIINANTGVISGSPATSVGSPFNVQAIVTDSDSVVATRTYSLTVAAPLSISGPASLPAGAVNLAYFTAVTASGGSGSYTWSATGLPPGLSIGAGTGVISGTPTATAGSPFTVQVTVTDSNSATAKATYTLTINSQPGGITLTISGPSTLPAGTVNIAYPATSLSAQGGSGSYTWSATGLPPGLSLGAATGVIAGTPASNSGSPYQVQVTVTDSAAAKATRAYALTVNGQLSISAPASLPAGTVNVPYAATTAIATGGSGIYAWSATGLPPGLSVGATTGVISGTPVTNAGSPFNSQVTVTDSNSAAAARGYTVTINMAPVTLPAIRAVVNAAVGQSAVAPNTWVSIYGSNFASPGFTDDWSKSIANGNLPIELDGVSVTTGGQAAYIAYLSASQINVLLPNLGFGALQVTVTTPAGTSAPVTFNSQQYSPAFFTWPNNQPVATHIDYTPAVKNGTFAGTANVPAKPGEVIILWGTGFGPTNPAAPFGVEVPNSPAYYTADSVSVMIGNTPALVYGVALAPGFAGLYQLVVTLPAPLADGDFAVVAGINGAQTPAATLTIQN